jgi:putative hydrolase of HD superfamily
MRKSLVLKLFDGFTIQRWNDKIRPVELTEMDKHAHKMMIAYCLAKYEESEGKKIEWHNLIRGGIFELLRRVTLSDIKSPIYRKIKEKYHDTFLKLNQWIFSELEPTIDNKDIESELNSYLLEENSIDRLSQDILDAAHIYASYWEFQIIKKATPDNNQIYSIERIMLNDINNYLHLKGMQMILSKMPISSFIDLVGQLRFQIRWGNTTRIPITSVLGHSLMVACLNYFFSRELDACETRLKNNFWNGLFHDLPEAATRDIISPVKGAVSELPKIIGEIEEELVEEEIYPYIEDEWKNDFRYYIRDEFASKIKKNDKIEYVTSDDINKNYNYDDCCPLDGEITKCSDHLSAFVEAYKAIESGIKAPQIVDGLHNLKNMYKGKKVAGLNLGSIYADF